MKLNNKLFRGLQTFTVSLLSQSTVHTIPTWWDKGLWMHVPVKALNIIPITKNLQSRKYLLVGQLFSFKYNKELLMSVIFHIYSTGLKLIEHFD